MMGHMPGYAAGMPPMYYPPEYGMPGGQRQLTRMRYACSREHSCVAASNVQLPRNAVQCKRCSSADSC
jgi:hypothetical protein